MAKKLIHKYTFTPATNTIVIPEIIKQSRFLLITNMTDGITIFTFNSQATGFTSYTIDTTAKTTTIVLDKDCSAMSATDDLQIFVEEDKVSISPDETYSDPVSKLRVSTPENLIDTDFEYGLQPSKWETLELVKNVPTFFNRDGDTGLEVTDVTTTNGSVEVQVALSSEHGFSPGAPIIVKSTRSNSCNGAFVVTATPSSTTFSYKAKNTQTFTGSIFDTYTEIYYGSVYQGTEFKLSGLDAIRTDNQNPSTLTVSTESPTDFKVGTSFFLTNSLGTQNLTFDASAVNTSLSTSTSKTFAIAADNTLSGRRRTNGFQTYAWQAKEGLMFLPSEVTLNSSTNQITINNHGLRDNQAYLWSSGLGNQFGNIAATNNGGGTVNSFREKIFYVRNIDANNFYLTETFNSTSRVGITSTTVVDGGLYKLELMPAYGMRYYSSSGFWFAFSGLWEGGDNFGGYYSLQKRQPGLPPDYMFASASGRNGIADFTGTDGYITPGTGDERFWVRWWSDGDHSISYANGNYADTEPMHKHNLATPQRNWIISALGMRYFYKASTTSYYSMTNVGFYNFENLTSTAHRYSGSGNVYNQNLVPSKNIYMIPVTFNDDYSKFYQTNHGLTNHQAYVVTSSSNTYTDQTTSSSVNAQPDFSVTSSGGTTGNGGTNTLSQPNNVFKVMNADSSGFYLGQHTNLVDSPKLSRGAVALGTNFTLKPYWTRSNQAIATSVGDTQFKTADENAFTIPMPSNTLTDSDPLVYDDNGNTTVGGLTDNTTYYAATTTSDHIRLASQVQGVYPWGYNPDTGQTSTNGSTVYQVYSASDTSHDGGFDRLRMAGTSNFNTGDLVQYIERNGQIAGLINGAFYYYREYNLNNTIYFNLFYDKALAMRDYTTDPLTGFNQTRPYGRIHLPNNATYSNPNYRGEFRRTTIKELTSVGSGTQNLQNTSIGGSDGVYRVSGVTDNKTYTMAANGQLPSRTFTVISIKSVDLNRNAIKYTNHGFTTGSSFTVNNTNIGGLATGTTYYAINVGKDWFKAAASVLDAEQGVPVDLTSTSVNDTSFTSTSLAGQSLGDGTVSCESGSVQITGTATNFPSKYTVGDNFKITVAQTLTPKACSGISANVFACTGHGLSDGDALINNHSAAPSNLLNEWIVYAGNTSNPNSFTVHLTAADAIAGTNVVSTFGGANLNFDHITTIDSYEEGVIKYVNNITSLELASGASQTLTDANYMIETSLLVRADGFALHRPYDGGVELVPSTNPDSQMIRQTRKYFRYQSGKGIQNSLAINFSPTTDIDTFSAAGNVGTISTRYAHRLSEGLNVTVKGASVSGGLNTYNNSFRVVSVPTENSFTVAFDTTLTLDANVTVGEGETITQTNSGTTGIVRSAVTNSNTLQLHTVRTPLSDVNVAVTVTNPSGSQNLYTFDGVAAPANYSMTEGRKYIFNLDDSSNDGHPMRIADGVDGASYHNNSVYKLNGSVVPYSDWSNATTFNAATTRTLEVTFPAYSGNFYYACHFHGGMGNSIVTAIDSTGAFTTNAADVLTADVTGALTAYPTSSVNAPSDTIANGILGFTVDSWSNSVLRAGMFDDQNGLFWEYDGSTLAAVVRSSTQQLSGFVSTTFKSTLVSGTDTKFATQVNVGDRIIIKGQTYRITAINSDTSLNIIPSYRGVTGNNIIVTKTVDNKVTQNNWNIDKCDGTGPTSFVLDKTKIHMSYIDYSWYGAGKVRFGFKDQNGNVMYVHQFVHNNLETEAYMRSGNVPGRYEIENTGIPTYVPALAHWGTSVIMDGRFDNDKAYVFTAAGNNMTITGSDQLVVSGKFETTSPYYIRHSNYKYYYAGYGLTVATPNNEYNSLTSGVSFSGTNAGASNTTTNPLSYLLTPVQPYQAGARVSTSYQGYNSSVKNLILVNNQPSGVDSTDQNYTFTLSAGGGVSVTEPVPLISIRLAPSVDNGTPGLLGEREIINRMQLAMKQVGILSTHAAEIEIKLNGNIDNNDWQRVTVPSLSQLVYHSATDTVTGGNTIFSFRAQGGTGTSGRTAVTTTQSLAEISDLGNSILGGDNVFPDGPDVVTIVARLVEDPSTVSSSNPFQISGRVSWAESQA